MSGIKVRGTLIQRASSQPGLVRDTIVLLEYSITVEIPEEHKRMEDPWLLEPDAMFLASRRREVVRIESFITPCYSFPFSTLQFLCSLAQARRAAQ
ncbi:hypothetical protein TNCV_1551821 [Trichonephila clavipes]|nr:hypothetical protein TNCV_1551821 [Trichonephila clavipes]